MNTAESDTRTDKRQEYVEYRVRPMDIGGRDRTHRTAVQPTSNAAAASNHESDPPVVRGPSSPGAPPEAASWPAV